jgi:8-oxo-dGTP diphosphatase
MGALLRYPGWQRSNCKPHTRFSQKLGTAIFPMPFYLFYPYLRIMKKVAQIILENDRGELLLYLRDGKPGIPFPYHWDLIGGHLEEGETPDEALVREVKEEINIDLAEYKFFREYICLEGDAYPNIKYIYHGRINLPVEKITLNEGERLQYFSREEIDKVKFANILKKIVLDYVNR